MNLINLIVSRQIRSFRALSSRFAGFKLTSVFQATHFVCICNSNFVSIQLIKGMFEVWESKFSQNREASVVFAFQESVNRCGSCP